MYYESIHLESGRHLLGGVMQVHVKLGCLHTQLSLLCMDAILFKRHCSTSIILYLLLLNRQLCYCSFQMLAILCRIRFTRPPLNQNVVFFHKRQRMS